MKVRTIMNRTRTSRADDARRPAGPVFALTAAALLTPLLAGCGSGGTNSSVGALPASGTPAASASAAAVTDPDLVRLRGIVDALGKDTSVNDAQAKVTAGTTQLRNLRTQSQDDLNAFYTYNRTTGKDCAVVRSKAAVVSNDAGSADSVAAGLTGLISDWRGKLAARSTTLADANRLVTTLSSKHLDPASADALSGLRTSLSGFTAGQGASQQALDQAVKDQSDLPPQVRSRATRAADLAARCLH